MGKRLSVFQVSYLLLFKIEPHLHNISTVAAESGTIDRPAREPRPTTTTMLDSAVPKSAGRLVSSEELAGSASRVQLLLPMPGPSSDSRFLSLPGVHSSALGNATLVRCYSPVYWSALLVVRR